MPFYYLSGDEKKIKAHSSYSTYCEVKRYVNEKKKIVQRKVQTIIIFTLLYCKQNNNKKQLLFSFHSLTGHLKLV